MRRGCFPGVGLLLGLAACTPAPAPETDPAGPSTEAIGPATDTAFQGRIVALHPFPIAAPPNTFQLAGWNSTGSWTQLLDLPADGTAVKKGDVVGRFKFRAEGALAQIEQHLQEALADADREQSAQEAKVRDLRHARDRARITAERARVDQQRSVALAAREAKRLEIEARLADFEADAADKRLAAAEAQRAAVLMEKQREVELRQLDRRLFDVFKARFEARAPADGVLRYGWLFYAKRRVQKGDDMPCGTEYAAVAPDARLAVRFYVPEARLGDATLGRRVHAEGGDGKISVDAIVQRVEPFPQALGFLESDWNLTSAQEKFYVVVAAVEGTPALPAGVETKVHL